MSTMIRGADGRLYSLMSDLSVSTEESPSHEGKTTVAADYVGDDHVSGNFILIPG